MSIQNFKMIFRKILGFDFFPVFSVKRPTIVADKDIQPIKRLVISS